MVEIAAILNPSDSAQYINYFIMALRIILCAKEDILRKLINKWW